MTMIPKKGVSTRKTSKNWPHMLKRWALIWAKLRKNTAYLGEKAEEYAKYRSLLNHLIKMRKKKGPTMITYEHHG
ncbi:hypothetical protein GQ600_22715 [Phytophthora cactorum]|nr:hypothetical protein GQ600_22715 [Phytophthora cactorum]